MIASIFWFIVYGYLSIGILLGLVVLYARYKTEDPDLTIVSGFLGFIQTVLFWPRHLEFRRGDDEEPPTHGV